MWILIQRYQRAIKWILVLSVIAAFGYFAYTVTRPTLLEFYVYDSESGAPLADAVVEVQNANGQKIVELVTDNRGWAGVKRLIPGGGYRALAKHLDYVLTERRGLVVKLHKTVSVKMPLQAKPGGRLYVGMQNSYLAVIDTASYLFASFKKGPAELGESQIQQILAHPERPWIYVLARNRALALRDSTLDMAAALRTSGSVNSLALSGDGKQIVAAVFDSGVKLLLLDAFSGTLQSSVSVPFASRTARMLFAPQSQVAYLFDVGSGGGVASAQLLAMDLKANQPARISIRARASWAALSPDESLLLLGSPESDQLIRVDARQRQLIGSTRIGTGISAIAFSRDGQRIYLANETLGMLTILDAKSFELLAQAPVGRRPVAIVTDAQDERVYVANADSQNISVVDVKTRQVIETISLEVTPVCLAMR
jgi:YVTN family beta-propeller protein